MLSLSVGLFVCKLQTHLELVILSNVLLEGHILFLDYLVDTFKLAFNVRILFKFLFMSQCLLLLADFEVVHLILQLLALLLQRCILL